MPSTLLSHLFLLGLRSIYFLGCRRYVHRSLLADLRQVIRDDPIESTETNTLSPNLDSDDEVSSGGLSSWFQTAIPKAGPSSLKHDLLPVRTPKRAQPSSTSSPLSTGLTTFLFCWSFCEGSLLFSIVILGSWLDPAFVHARLHVFDSYMSYDIPQHNANCSPSMPRFNLMQQRTEAKLESLTRPLDCLSGICLPTGRVPAICPLAAQSKG